MLGEIVYRAIDRFAPFQRGQMLHHQVGIKGIRMVVVGAAAFVIGQMILTLVIIVVADYADLVSKAFLHLLNRSIHS